MDFEQGPGKVFPDDTSGAHAVELEVDTETGAVQGLGSGLMEEVVLQDGVTLTTLFGARGIGEPPIGPPATAFANAIEDATGVGVTALPIIAERMARALGLVAP